MSSDPSVEGARSITEGPVTVTKSFEADEFPVPAVKFVIESDASESVSIRLVDTIPESFPMENVGFHPDYEKDNWTAYKSHRVEYDRTLDPGESTTTVYGIRLDDTDLEPDAFLSDPSLSTLDADDVRATDDAIGDVLGEDSNQLVRDVLSGDRDALPGLGADAGVDAPDLTADASGGGDPHPEDVALELDDEANGDAAEAEAEHGDVDEAPRPDAFDDSGESATEPAEHAVAAVDADGADDDSAPGDGDVATPQEDLELELDLDEHEEGTAAEEDSEADTDADVSVDIETAEAPSGPRVTAGSVLAALAAELQREDADPDDVDALRDALGAGSSAGEGESDTAVPRSVDLRIKRLQNQVEDLAAYSAGLEAFLDEEGTAEELIEGFRSNVDDLTEELDELSADVADAEDDRGRLREDVDGLQSELSGLDDQLETVESRVEETAEQLDGVDDRFDAIDERLDTVEDRFDAVDDRLDETAGRLEAVDGRLDETTDRLDETTERLAGVDDRFDAVEDRLDEVVERAERADDTATRLDDEMGEVRDELATLDGDITAAREALEAELEEVHETVEEEAAPVREDVSALREDVADLDDTVEEFRAFRDRLSNALGPMVGGSADTPHASGEDDGEANADAESAGDEADAEGTGDDGDADADAENGTGADENADDGDDENA